MRYFIDSKNSRGHGQKRLAQAPFIVGILVTAGLSTSARAADTIISVTGTVLSGTDKSGVFFPGKPNTDLAGKPYILTFTFNDTLGTEQFTASQSYIKNTATSNPGTAVLQIGGGPGSFGFGTLGYSPYASEAYLTAGVGGSYSLQAGDGSYGGNWNNIQGTIYPAARTALTRNPSWKAAFSDADLYVSPLPSNNYSLSFGILEEVLNKVVQSASGYLTVTSITVAAAPLAFGLPRDDPRRSLADTRKAIAIDLPHGETKLLQVASVETTR